MLALPVLICTFGEKNGIGQAVGATFARSHLKESLAAFPPAGTLTKRLSSLQTSQINPDRHAGSILHYQYWADAIKVHLVKPSSDPRNRTAVWGDLMSNVVPSDAVCHASRHHRAISWIISKHHGPVVTLQGTSSCGPKAMTLSLCKLSKNIGCSPPASRVVSSGLVEKPPRTVVRLLEIVLGPEQIQRLRVFIPCSGVRTVGLRRTRYPLLPLIIAIILASICSKNIRLASPALFRLKSHRGTSWPVPSKYPSGGRDKKKLDLLHCV